MIPLLFSMPGSEVLAGGLHDFLACEPGTLHCHRFPDGESGFQFITPVAGRQVIFAARLDDPDSKMLPLYLAASVARELGASCVGLVAPYLPYMRQDARFHEGEGITSAHFAKLVSGCFDWLVTVDPHLHRYASLAEIYPIPSRVVPAAPALSRWIAAHVGRPVVVGPDAESAQWAAAVAQGAGCPWKVLHKVRSGDREVAVSLLDADGWEGRTPVLVDDIVSTGRTMIAAAAQIRAAGLPRPVCLAVHALFAGDALHKLKAAGVAQVVSCNTVAHATNAIDLHSSMANAVVELLRKGWR